MKRDLKKILEKVAGKVLFQDKIDYAKKSLSKLKNLPK